MNATPQQRLSGVLPWPHDVLFRPTVGVFAQGRLVAAAACRRRPGDWACVYDLAAPSGETVALRCLETGAALSAPAPQPRDKLSVADLLARAETTSPAWDATGIAQVLAMPVLDQVSLVYFCVLARAPGDEEMRGACEEMLIGATTLLDLRDHLLASAEFADKARAQVSQRLGHWLVWGGLAGAAESFAATRGRAAMGAGAPQSARNHLEVLAENGRLGDYLARLALGADDPAEIAAWRSDHAALVASLAPSRSQPRAAPLARHSPMVLRNVLSALSLGEAGRRDGARVVSRPGTIGTVVYGPYWGLAPGGYELRLSLKGGGGALLVEIVQGDAALAWRVLREEDFAAGEISLGFAAPADVADLVFAKYEFRIRNLGGADVALSDMVLVRAPDARAVVVPDNDWLALLQVGGGGRRASGDAIASPRELGGNVFYGPYRALLPGDYLLSVETTQTGFAAARAALEVEVASAARRLALATGERADGAVRLDLPFTVAAEHWREPLEFRLEKPQGVDLHVHSVRLRRPARPPAA